MGFTADVDDRPSTCPPETTAGDGGSIALPSLRNDGSRCVERVLDLVGSLVLDVKDVAAELSDEASQELFQTVGKTACQVRFELERHIRAVDEHRLRLERANERLTMTVKRMESELAGSRRKLVDRGVGEGDVDHVRIEEGAGEHERDIAGEVALGATLVDCNSGSNFEPRSFCEIDNRGTNRGIAGGVCYIDGAHPVAAAQLVPSTVPPVAVDPEHASAPDCSSCIADLGGVESAVDTGSDGSCIEHGLEARERKFSVVVPAEGTDQAPEAGLPSTLPVVPESQTLGHKAKLNVASHAGVCDSKPLAQVTDAGACGNRRTAVRGTVNLFRGLEDAFAEKAGESDESDEDFAIFENILGNHDEGDYQKKLEHSARLVQRYVRERNRQYGDMKHSILLEAAECADERRFAMLIRRAASLALNAVDPLGRTVLHIAARHGLTRAAELILAHPKFVSADKLHHGGWTALHVAARQVHVGVVKAILASPSFTSVEAADTNGRTALHCACVNGNAEIVRAICSHPKFRMLDHANDGGFTALHIAERYGHEATCQVIAEFRAAAIASRTLQNFTSQSALVPSRPALDHGRRRSHASLFRAARSLASTSVDLTP